MDATAVAFPYPGIYTGTVRGGTLTYRIHGDGKGLSCVRGMGAKLFLGDVIYDGKSLHTEDGSIDVVSATREKLELRAPYLSASLHRVDEPPTVCRDFFSSKAGH